LLNFDHTKFSHLFDANVNYTLPNIANALHQTIIALNLTVKHETIKKTTQRMSTRSLRSRRRKFISAGKPGVCIFHYHPMIHGSPVQKSHVLLRTVLASYREAKMVIELKSKH
jgi:hypothetical protein